MSITDELREWANGSTLSSWTLKKLIAIADRIDAEHERGMADAYLSGTPTDEQMTEHGWIRLPKDADGEYIRIGDAMETERFGVVEVEGFIHNAVAFSVYDPQPARICTVPANQCRHYHAPTVEDVLRDVVTLCRNTWKEESAFHFYDVDDVMESGNIAEYAAKLQLREDA